MLNHVALMGRIGRDPELRRTGTGKAVTSFSVACDRDFKNQDGERETDWVDVVAWGPTAEFVQKYFMRGSQIVVTGRLQVRSYEKDGQKRRATEVVAEHVYFAGSKGTGTDNNVGSTGSYGGYQAAAPASDYAELTDDDSQLPF